MLPRLRPRGRPHHGEARGRQLGNKRPQEWVSSATGWNREGANVLCVVCRTDPAAPPDAAISIIAVEGPVTGLVFERAIDTIRSSGASRAQFGFQNGCDTHHNLLDRRARARADGLRRSQETAALVGIFGVRLMRAAFRVCASFCSYRETWRRSRDHRAPGGRIRFGRCKDHDRSGALSQLARLPWLDGSVAAAEELQSRRRFLAPRPRYA